MSSASTIAKTILTAQGIEANTVADKKVISELEAIEVRENRVFFGRAVSQKQKDFFNLTSADWNQLSSDAKGVNHKPPMSQMYGYLWVYDFLRNSIPSNKSTVVKSVDNSTKASVWAQKNECASGYNQTHEKNTNLFGLGDIEIWADLTAVADVITFAQPQLIEVGDVIMINDVGYSVTGENVSGLVYEIDTALTDGIYECSYVVNFNPKLQVWPRLSAESLLSSVNY